jgi:hypothetical protein
MMMMMMMGRLAGWKEGIDVQKLPNCRREASKVVYRLPSM